MNMRRDKEGEEEKEDIDDDNNNNKRATLLQMEDISSNSNGVDRGQKIGDFAVETDDGRKVKGPGCAGMKTALARQFQH